MDKLTGSYTRNNKSNNIERYNVNRTVVKMPDVSELPALTEMYNSENAIKKSENKNEQKYVIYLILLVLIVSIIMYTLAYNFVTHKDEEIVVPAFPYEPTIV